MTGPDFQNGTLARIQREREAARRQQEIDLAWARLLTWLLGAGLLTLLASSIYAVLVTPGSWEWMP